MNKSFEQCISNICGLELAQLVDGGKYVVYGNRVVVVEGHKGICDYQPTKICFAFCKHKLEIDGADLKIRHLEKHYAVVCGNISCLAVQYD